MLVRFGYVAMSAVVPNASPSKTITATRFSQFIDREAGVRLLERIAEENLQNTLRLLRHNRAHDIKVYRFSSKLIPLFGNDMLEDWDPIPALVEPFAAVGDYVKQHDMRVSFQPDHLTILSTPREEVLECSKNDLRRHIRMIDAMGLDEKTKCNILVGGAFGNKAETGQRLTRQFLELEDSLRTRLTLQNDDKIFTARETLAIAEEAGMPMVLDIHHDKVNNEGSDLIELWPSIRDTWKGTGLPPKIHVSSPKSEKDQRSHADYVDVTDLLRFMRAISDDTPALDVMIEAKMKDDALFKLIQNLTDGKKSRVHQVDQAALEIFS